MENPVEKAIRVLGGTAFAASLKTGIHPTTIWKWARAGRVKDGAKAFIIAEATEGAVSARELATGVYDSENGDGPAAGPRFRRGRGGSVITATYPAPEPVPSIEPAAAA